MAANFDEYRVLVGDNYWKQFEQQILVRVPLIGEPEFMAHWIPPRVMRMWAFWDSGFVEYLLEVQEDGLITVGGLPVQARDLGKYWNYFHDGLETSEFGRVLSSPRYSEVVRKRELKRELSQQRRDRKRQA